MKRQLLGLLFLVIAIQLRAQKIEFSVLANSGLFHYSGNAATATSYINEATSTSQNYTNNPYGNKNGFSYGADIQAQYVAKSGFIAGLQTGYDVLRSKVDITNVYSSQAIPFYFAAGPFYYPATTANGHTILQDEFINLSPYLGYRFKFKKVKIDLMPGIDVGFNLNAYEKGNAKTTDDITYRTDNKENNHPIDIRIKFGVAAVYRKLGITAGFAHGLTNYISLSQYRQSNPYYDPNYRPKLYSELLRFGLSYRIL